MRCLIILNNADFVWMEDYFRKGLVTGAWYHRCVDGIGIVEVEVSVEIDGGGRWKWKEVCMGRRTDEGNTLM